MRDLLQEDHETALVRAFVRKERVARWLEFLALPSRRADFLHRLADPRDLRPERRVGVSGSSIETVAILRSRGAPQRCHVVSEIPALDGRFLNLTEAVEQIRGTGLGTIVSCIPGRLALYEGERQEDRCLLVVT